MEDDDSRADAPCSASGRLDDAAYVLARARGAIVGGSADGEQHVTVGHRRRRRTCAGPPSARAARDPAPAVDLEPSASRAAAAGVWREDVEPADRPTAAS
jgi:hypothetical protein